MSKENITAESFCYWLQGKFELDGEVKALSKEQVAIISEHLQKVFNKKTSASGEDALKLLKKKFPDMSAPIC